MTIVRLLCMAIAVILTGGIGWGVMVLCGSLPALDGRITVAELQAAVTVTSDDRGIPVIAAGSRSDALRALGFVTARDRLFQMDLLRRSSAGRLAEIFGQPALDMDVKQRTIGFAQVAEGIMRRLPGEQQAALEAYAEGVNAFLTGMNRPPFECVMLGYRPAMWRPEDSLLVVLGMFQMLNGSDDDERMRTIMHATLPADVSTFLIPTIDPYTDRLLHGTDTPLVQRPVPVQSLAGLRRPADQIRSSQISVVRLDTPVAGSNAWAVGGGRTTDGRAILANDMHLDVAVPNIWYRVQLRYQDVEMAGMVVPGIPVMIAGSNGHVAWGLTNVEGDFLDLVRLELNPHQDQEYATPDGWRPFAIRRETITVKGGETRALEVKETIWGPLSAEPLLGRPVAMHWTALDPEAVDVGLVHMDRARSLSEALSVLNRAAGPGNNVLLADADGHIAWTYTGRIPIRRGFDGSVSVSWADGRAGWSGFIAPHQMPRIVDPPAGFLVSANQRMLAEDSPYLIGHAFAGGYRAYRITERLRMLRPAREPDLLALQLDTTTEVYEFYRALVERLLSPDVLREKPHLADVHRVVRAWSGRADADSTGFGLLVAFRKSLAQSVFTPFLAVCREQDERFVYDGDLDTPLRAILAAQAPPLLPDPEQYRDWNAFLLHVLERRVEELMAEHGAPTVDALTWGSMNRVQITHPLAEALPGLGLLLNMPQEDAPGCSQCVRVVSGSLVASQRMVVSPGRHGDGILHMPGGQSGHPLSPHYRDQHPYWSQGLSSPLLAGPAVHHLVLTPASAQALQSM